MGWHSKVELLRIFVMARAFARFVESVVGFERSSLQKQAGLTPF